MERQRYDVGVSPGGPSVSGSPKYSAFLEKVGGPGEGKPLFTGKRGFPSPGTTDPYREQRVSKKSVMF